MNSAVVRIAVVGFFFLFVGRDKSCCGDLKT